MSHILPKSCHWENKRKKMFLPLLIWWKIMNAVLIEILWRQTRFQSLYPYFWSKFVFPCQFLCWCLEILLWRNELLFLLFAVFHCWKSFNAWYHLIFFFLSDTISFFIDLFHFIDGKMSLLINENSERLTDEASVRHYDAEKPIKIQ